MNKYKIATVAILMLSPIVVSASVITPSDVLSDWTPSGSPIDGGTDGVWTQSGSSIVGSGNHRASLLSDFSNSDSFGFSVDSRARDNDLFGLMWGVQDLSNHYRFSWGQERNDGGNTGWTGSGGFNLYKEVGGVATGLFNSNIEYVIGNDYNLNVLGTAGGFDVLITNLTTSTNIFNISIADTTFTSGRVGVHEWYQGNSNVWSNFDNSQTVPEPSVIALMGLGVFGLGISRRKMKK